MASPIIVDTGPLVALLDRRDHHHTWAKSQLMTMQAPMLTCESVLAETAFLLRQHDRGLRRWAALVTDEIVQLSFSMSDQFESLVSLLAKYQDTPMSLADACIVRMSELHSHASVFTTDSDFFHYRRNGRSVISLIHPDR